MARVCDHPDYSVWRAMVSRCHTPTDWRYGRYGALGITVAEEWRHGPEGRDRFLAYMGPRPPGAQVERIDGSQPYEPGNVRWRERARRTRASDRVTIDGETRTVRDWTARAGLTASLVEKRIARGWTVERAVTEPRVEAVAL